MAVNLKTLSQSYPLLKFSETAEPTWGEDAGRNANDGSFSGTFCGYFTNIHLDFGHMTKTQMDEIKAIFEVPIIENVTFPNSSNYGADYTEDFYGTAIKAELDDWNGLYKPFSIDLVAVVQRYDI
jgi:hypothetical protein